MKRIRVGIIGQGRSGRNIHAVVFNTEKLKEKFQLAAVADLDIARCKESCEENPGCKAYTDFREMLKDSSLDLIVNASQSPDHVPFSIEAMEAGHAVLCEKPLARTVSEADRVIAASKRTGQFFAVFQQSRFAPTFRKVLEVMNSGVLGRIVMVRVVFNGFSRRWDWQTLQDMNAGSLLNTGPHPLDQALQFFGNVDPETVFCRMDRANTWGDAEDHVKVILTAKGHPVIDMEVSSCAPPGQRVYEVYGTNGTLHGSHSELEWRFFDPADAPAHHLIREPLPDRAYCSEKLSFTTEKWTSSEQGMDFSYRTIKLYENLYDALVNGGKLEVTLEQVRRQIAVIEECHRQNPLSKLPLGV
ncbi:MAG: putative oxidoreductase YdgJ [Lentisphaerae bacterium ADurb.Bin242]|nr:MAG: putative oxidoreductase YdgJ [Lentisphaerae bacterium ADurb.Bin242]